MKDAGAQEASKVMWAIGAAQERYVAKMKSIGRQAAHILTTATSNSVSVNQARIALETHLVALKEMTISLESSEEVLKNPSAKITEVSYVYGFREVDVCILLPLLHSV